ncbi:uncharacterized protein LOC118411017 [Branchiostoma floridae]|uniref:Uncharacterized protein LOC118411017 n=1 Tax=Branchiostoma floridae TaxID=7739 RepID=A0A9J7MIT4_BRAFL|nr:uncharacterized protein LOC118411017 [Branchiostoma floridae]
MADQQGLSNKDKVCQFFASNAGLHFRSADVAAALGLDGRSVGQQLARLWRAGFVEKVQTTPYATWRMKLHTYPGRNLHGPAAPKPAIPTPAKKSTRGSRSHEEVRNDTGHCPMGSPMVQGWREGENEEQEEEEEVGQESSLVEVPSVRMPAFHSVSSKPPPSTRREATSSQENISVQKKAAEIPTTKRKLGRLPGNKLSATTLQVGLRGSKTGKTTAGFCQKTACVATGLKRKVSSDSKNADQGRKGRVKKTVSQTQGREVNSDRCLSDSESSLTEIVGTVQKRKVVAETTIGNQGVKGKVKKRKSQPALREDSIDRSSTDSESSSPKVVRTVLKWKVGAEKTKGNQGMKGIVKKTTSQTMDKDCSDRSGVDSQSQVQNKTQLMPTTVSCQRTSTTAVKKNTDKVQKRKVIKKTMTQTTCREGEGGAGGIPGSLQNKARLMPVTLAPTLIKPAGNMETKLLNFIQEAQGMLVMTGNDVAKALGSKPKETHRLLLHMQRTGQVRKVCDKPTRWMMLGGGQGRRGLARKGQRQGSPSTKYQSMSIPASRNLHSGTATSTQASRNLHSETATSTLTSRNLHSGTTTSTLTSRNIHSGTASSTQASRNLHTGTATSIKTSRNLHTGTATEGSNSRTSHSVRAQSGDGLVEERQTFLTLPSKEEEEDDTEIAFTSTQWSIEPERCLTTEEEEDEDISCVSHEQESILLEDVEFWNSNEFNNRETASRIGGQKYNSEKGGFMAGSDGCKQSTCSLSLVEDVGTDPRRARGQGVYAEQHGNSRSGKTVSTTGAKGVEPSLTREKNTLVRLDASQNAEELMSEKFLQIESARWQRPRSPKSFLTDYWSKADSKDAKRFDAENKTVDSFNSRLLAYPTTSVEIIDSEEECPSDLSKNCSKSKICISKVSFKDNANLTDEKSQIVLKEEPKTFHTTKTQTSQEFVHSSQAMTSKSIDQRYSLKNSPTKVQSDEDDVVVSLEERAGGQAVSSPIGPLEQSTWTQPKALYTSNETEPVEQGETEAEETGGQEKAPVGEGKGHDGSEVGEVIIHQSSVARVTPQGGRQVATLGTSHKIPWM